MNVHNEWRHAQGLPPLPSKFKRLQEQEPRDQPSAQADPPTASADFLDPVPALLAVADDDSNDSDSAEEGGFSMDDDAALADESLATVEGHIEVQAQRKSFGLPVDRVLGQHLHYGYASPFAFAEAVKLGLQTEAASCLIRRVHLACRVSV
jgi:hypothetical protein